MYDQTQAWLMDDREFRTVDHTDPFLYDDYGYPYEDSVELLAWEASVYEADPCGGQPHPYL